MRRVRVVGSCLAAVFVLSAICAAVASAEPPEYKTCVKAGKNAVTKKYEGTFTDAACTQEATEKEEEEGKTNKYELDEWNAGKKTTFTGKNGVSTLDSYIPEHEATFWEGGTVAGTVVCKSAKSAGETTGPKTGTVTVTFATCTSEGKKCTSVQTGEKVGDITTNLLHTIIGFNEHSEVVSLVEGGSEGVANQAEFTCEGLAVETNGSLLGVDTGNINTISSSSTQTFAVNGKGGQDQVFAGVPPESAAVWGPGTENVHVLKSHITPPGVSLPSGENTTSTLKGEKLEIATKPTPFRPKWWVAGKLFKGTEPLAESTTVTEPFKLILTEEQTAEIGRLVCTEVKVKGGAITSPSARTESEVEYAGCKVFEAEPNSSKENTSCHVTGGHIVTNPLKAVLEGPHGAEKLKFVPQSGTELGLFEIEGSSCSFKGKFHIDGRMICNYAEVEEEKVEHPLEFTPSSGTEVSLSGPTTTKPNGITVDYKVHLNSGKTWSAF